MILYRVRVDGLLIVLFSARHCTSTRTIDELLVSDVRFDSQELYLGSHALKIIRQLPIVYAELSGFSTR